jgi:hypothetical protein
VSAKRKSFGARSMHDVDHIKASTQI